MDRERDEREEARKVDTIERALGPRNTAGPSRDLTDAERIDIAFTYQRPDEDRFRQYAVVRAAGKTLALAILNAAPKCADRTDAIRKVREAVMTANAAIALDGLI